MLPAFFEPLIEDADIALLCEDRDVINYVVENEILMIPECYSMVDKVHKKRNCRSVSPEKDILNADTLGGLNLFDIVHFAYGGDSGFIFKPYRRSYNILYAGSYDPRDVYSLLQQVRLVQLDKKYTGAHNSSAFGYEDVVIYILIYDAKVLEDLNVLLSSCDTVQKDTYEFITADYLRTEGAHLEFDLMFYINDMSTNEYFSADLRKYREMLTADGVIVASVYSENILTNRLRRQLLRNNRTAHVPFSVDSVKFVAEALKVEGYSKKIQRDESLLRYIATIPISLGGTAWQKSYSGSELSRILEQHGFKEISFVPSMIRFPYSELTNMYIYGI